MIKLVECPRDAMQGWKNLIPAKDKIRYINCLLRVGFDTIDFGSFVSPKTIPQMADTKEVLTHLDTKGSSSKLLAIVANTRGAVEAANFEKITFLGYPFSVSETFQRRNTHSTIADSLKTVQEIQSICVHSGKKLVIYISMAFGNPYEEPFSEHLVYEWIRRLIELDIGIVSLADTVGVATPEQVFTMTDYVIKKFPKQEIGVHLHSSPSNQQKKIEAALRAHCNRFDGALKGIGGCPMANDELVGNIDTEWMIDYFREKSFLNELNLEALSQSLEIAGEIFN